jgi:hypothetical protein
MKAEPYFPTPIGYQAMLVESLAWKWESFKVQRPSVSIGTNVWANDRLCPVAHEVAEAMLSCKVRIP